MKSLAKLFEKKHKSSNEALHTLPDARQESPSPPLPSIVAPETPPTAAPPLLTTSLPALSHASSFAPSQFPSDDESLDPDSAPEIPEKVSIDDLWTLALKQVANEDKDLVQAYNEIISNTTGFYNNDTQAMAQKVVELQLAQVLNRQWRLQWHNATFEVRSLFNSVAELVIMFKDVGSAASSADPVHAALPWAGILLIFIPVVNEYSQNKTMLEGLAKITELVALYKFVVHYKLTGEPALASKSKFWKEVERDKKDHKELIFQRGLKQTYKKEIVALYAKILRYQIKAACSLNRNRLSNFVRNIPKIDDWNGMVQEIDEQDIKCQRYEGLLYGRDWLRTFEAHRELQEAKDYWREKHGKIPRFLSSISPINVKKDHEDVRYRLKPEYWDSGQWFLCSTEYIQWEQNPSSILWLEGPVGVGKSCLLSVVVERLLSTTTGGQVAYFYCSEQRSAARAKSSEILRAILKQLACGVRNELSPLADEWFSKNHNRTLSHEDGNNLLEQILIAEGQKTIVIDSLDECADPGELLNFLQEVNNRSSKLRILFSSRFGLHAIHKKCESIILIEHLDNATDMENYIVKETTSSRRIERSAITFRQCAELRTLLLRHGRGMFRWVELWLDLIISPEQIILHPQDIQEKLEQLRHFSKDPSREVAASLDEVYYNIFKRNTQGGISSRNLAVKALRWLLSALKPMTMESLVQAVALDIGGDSDRAVNAELICQICSNFIAVSKSGVVRLAHRSVKEYLIHSHERLVKRDSSSAEYDNSFVKGKCHARAVETCLTFVRSLGNAAWSHIPLDGKTKPSKVLTLSSFELYACLLWPVHYQEAAIVRDAGRLGQQFWPLFDSEAEATPVRRWINILWQYFHSPQYAECPIQGHLPRQLQDAISHPPNPFLTACIFGFADIVSVSLQRTPDLTRFHNERGKSVLYLACENGHEDTAKILIELGADVNEIQRHWGSILHAAAWGGNSDVFYQVLNKVTDIHGHGYHGNIFDALLSGGNKKLVCETFRRGWPVWHSDKEPIVDHIGQSSNVLQITEKGNSLILRDANKPSLDYEKLRFDIYAPVALKWERNHQVRSHSGFNFEWERLNLIEDLANTRRFEIINCLRLVSKDYDPKLHRRLQFLVPWDRLLFEPEALDGAAITVDHQVFGTDTQRSQDFIQSYWESQKIPMVSTLCLEETALIICPVCFDSQHRTLEQWQQVLPLVFLSWSVLIDSYRGHIIHDLLPYVCPFFPKCKSRRRLYGDYEQWRNHLIQEHGPNRRFAQSHDDVDLAPVTNFDLDQFLTDGLYYDKILQTNDEFKARKSFDRNAYAEGKRRGSQEDLCPICLVNLFPVYSAGIDSRERHVARHMENVALALLETDADPIEAIEESNPSQSDRQSIQSWSSGTSGYNSEANDSGATAASSEDSDISGRRGRRSMRVPSYMKKYFQPPLSRSISSERGQVKMDMTALTDGVLDNDDMLSIFPQTKKESGPKKGKSKVGHAQCESEFGGSHLASYVGDLTMDRSMDG